MSLDKKKEARQKIIAQEEIKKMKQAEIEEEQRIFNSLRLKNDLYLAAVKERFSHRNIIPITAHLLLLESNAQATILLASMLDALNDRIDLIKISDEFSSDEKYYNAYHEAIQAAVEYCQAERESLEEVLVELGINDDLDIDDATKTEGNKTEHDPQTETEESDD